MLPYGFGIDAAIRDLGREDHKWLKPLGVLKVTASRLVIAHTSAPASRAIGLLDPLKAIARQFTPIASNGDHTAI